MVDVDSTTGTGHPRKALDNASSYLQARRRETPPRHHNEQQKRRQECPGRNTQKTGQREKVQQGRRRWRQTVVRKHAASSSTFPEGNFQRSGRQVGRHERQCLSLTRPQNSGVVPFHVPTFLPADVHGRGRLVMRRQLLCSEMCLAQQSS